jgi:RNA polymerase sigma-70 factor (ECF subfamily)
VFDSIVSLLVNGVIPADLRGALLKAAAMIPGIEIVDDSAVLDGRRGTAIGKTSADGSLRTDLILDATTGRVIGERTIQLNASNGIPADTEVESSSITLSVVDTVPHLPTSYLPKPG